MKFRASFCDPFNPIIIELGSMSEDRIISYFEKIHWLDYLQKMSNAKDNKIYYSPSFEVQNMDTKHGISISVAGEPSNFEFYLFYERPKKVKIFFGLREKICQNYLTDVTGQTENDARECLEALLRNDNEFLANKIGY